MFHNSKSSKSPILSERGVLRSTYSIRLKGEPVDPMDESIEELIELFSVWNLKNQPIDHQNQRLTQSSSSIKAKKQLTTKSLSQSLKITKEPKDDYDDEIIADNSKLTQSLNLKKETRKDSDYDEEINDLGSSLVKNLVEETHKIESHLHRRTVKKQSAFEITLQQHELTQKREIGEGQHGSAMICRLSSKATRSPINKLIANDQNQVVVKKPAKEQSDIQPISTTTKDKVLELRNANGVLYCNQNELSIYSYLQKNSLYVTHRKYPDSVIIHDKSAKNALLVLPYFYYGKNKNKFASSDLKNFLTLINTRFKNKDLSFNPNNCIGLDYFMDSIILSMYKAQYQLHQLRLLHLDTAARNFVIRSINTEDRTRPSGEVVIMDFGLSKILEDNDRHIFSYDYLNYNIPMPVYMFDNATLLQYCGVQQNKRLTIEFNLMTDLFAMRATIIETLGLLMGMDQDDIFTFNVLTNAKKNRAQFMKSWKEKALNCTDDERLAIYLSNVQFKADMLIKNHDIRGTIVMQLIKSYSPYLTQLTTLEKDYYKILEEDNYNFMNCHAINQQLSNNINREINHDDNDMNTLLAPIVCNKPNKEKRINTLSSSLGTHGVFRTPRRNAKLTKQEELVANTRNM